VERAGATFAQAFLAAVTLGSVTDMHAVEVAAIAGGYAVGKFLLVKANAYLATPSQSSSSSSAPNPN
jgi:hypothetical protein